MSTLTILFQASARTFEYTEGSTLRELLILHGYRGSYPCGGRGTCGKCTVTLLTEDGGRRVSACQTVPTGDCTVLLPDEDGKPDFGESRETLPEDICFPDRPIGAAVDLGTTTVAVRIYETGTGRLITGSLEWSLQKPYGADVISRCSYCMEHEAGLDELSEAIRTQVYGMISRLCGENGLQVNSLKNIILAGNTVMEHIFAGLSPVGISRAPYTPVTLFGPETRYSRTDLRGIPVFLTPCISGYVGGDIVAGLLYLGLHRRSGNALFIDVGTNGEMALGGADGIFTCSVACGPAFEGAEISCGMPAAPGAINRVDLTAEGLTCGVIGDTGARGICGSGLLDLAACLLELGRIDSYGSLEEDDDGEAIFRITDRVFITQRDVRQLQLAKAAISAGIYRLTEEAGITVTDIDALYLAGGFGSGLRPGSAARIGMLPKELADRTFFCGNTSLDGAKELLLQPGSLSEISELISKCRYIELSGDDAFSEMFVDEMNFPEEFK